MVCGGHCSAGKNSSLALSLPSSALGSITTNKASGGDRILAELVKIPKHAAVKALYSICQPI